MRNWVIYCCKGLLTDSVTLHVVYVWMSNSELCTSLTPVNTMKRDGSSNSWNSCRGRWEEKEGPPPKTEDGDNPKRRFTERPPHCGLYQKQKFPFSTWALFWHFATFYSSNFTQRSQLSTPYIFQTGSLLSLLIISLLSWLQDFFLLFIYLTGTSRWWTSMYQT